jgi:hypothetical protein
MNSIHNLVSLKLKTWKEREYRSVTSRRMHGQTGARDGSGLTLKAIFKKNGGYAVFTVCKKNRRYQKPIPRYRLVSVVYFLLLYK